MLLHILEHPVAADILLHTSGDAVEPSVIADNGSAKLGDVVLKVNEVLALFVGYDIVEVNIFVTPFKVMNNAFVSELLLDNEDILEEVINTFVDVEMIKLCNHGLLVLQVSFVLVNEGIAFIDHTSQVLEGLSVCLLLKFSQRVLKRLIFALLSLQLKVHVFDLRVVAL